MYFTQPALVVESASASPRFVAAPALVAICQADPPWRRAGPFGEAIVSLSVMY